MALHHALRDLVTRLGPGVLEDADALLGTLDDYLDDADADPAALALVADAVRHGTLARLAGLLDNGAQPEAAVATAGAALSARRGTDERAARWAAAALGYAAGRIDDAVVGAAHANWQAGLRTRDVGPVPPPPPSLVVPPAPAPPPPAPAPVRTDPVRRTAVQEPPEPPDRVRRRERRPAWPALVALLLVAAGLAGWLVLRDQDPAADDGSAADDTAADGSGSRGTDPRADVSDDPSSTSDESRGAGTGTDATTGPGDRSYVAYANRTSGVSRVQVIEVGSGRVRTVAAAGNASQPSVSADGRTVAFILETAEGKRLAVSRGGDAPLLLDVGQDPADPAISPDGAAVAYVTRTERGKDVSLRRLAETGATVVAGGTADEFDPSWSGDGTRLAYVLTGSSNDSIVVVDARSGAEVSRTPAVGHASSPALSPSGEEVAYVASVQGNAEVVVTEVGDGASPTNISRSDDTEVAVVWLPDGRLVTSAPGRGLESITTSSSDPEEITSGTSDSL